MEMLRLPDVRRRVGLSKSTIYTLIAAGEFVPSVAISARCRAWPSDAIDAWIKERIAKSEKTAAGHQAPKRRAPASSTRPEEGSRHER